MKRLGLSIEFLSVPIIFISSGERFPEKSLTLSGNLVSYKP